MANNVPLYILCMFFVCSLYVPLYVLCMVHTYLMDYCACFERVSTCKCRSVCLSEYRCENVCACVCACVCVHVCVRVCV